MLYIATALYLEAQPFITELNLKQCHEHTKFQVFQNDSVCLIVTGVGELKAAIGITYLFSKHNISSNDTLLNFGLCGAVNDSLELGMTYLCNKIKQHATGHICFPDMMLMTNYQEASIETCSHRVSHDQTSLYVTEDLVDMEAYGLYYAASYYMQAHQIMFLKVVSDHIKDSKITSNSNILDKDQLSKWLTLSAHSFIANYMNSETAAALLSAEQNTVITHLTLEETESYELLCQYLHLSQTMRLSLKQHMLYYNCLHSDLHKVLMGYLEHTEVIECHSKAEGKRYYDELKSILKR